MILFQVFHIFEEIGCGAYKIVGSLKKYLFAASGLVTVNFIFLSLIILNIRSGFLLGILGAGIATLNGFIHIVGYIKTKTVYESLGSGFFTGIPLGISGVYVLIQLIQALSP